MLPLLLLLLWLLLLLLWLLLLLLLLRLLLRLLLLCQQLCRPLRLLLCLLHLLLLLPLSRGSSLLHCRCHCHRDCYSRPRRRQSTGHELDWGRVAFVLRSRGPKLHSAGDSLSDGSSIATKNRAQQSTASRADRAKIAPYRTACITSFGCMPAGVIGTVASATPTGSGSA